MVALLHHGVSVAIFPPFRVGGRVPIAAHRRVVFIHALRAARVVACGLGLRQLLAATLVVRYLLPLTRLCFATGVALWCLQAELFAQFFLLLPVHVVDHGLH